MLNRMAKEKLRSTLLISAALAALAIGTGTATVAMAQPGSAFQNQGIRDDEGLPPRYGLGDNGLSPRYGDEGAWAYQRGGRVFVPRHEMRRHLRHR